ncbi:hypothetical protein BE21_00810 [Sorangium cellulosum]|uniref:Uncharacterized protein n=1 Tax=Sorangium cellulosum TaxID=56 RepID=A0A150U3B5_SORCE|nr:hypothetical protein BE21_00810 [Sorangium cellulosum]
MDYKQTLAYHSDICEIVASNLGPLKFKANQLLVDDKRNEAHAQLDKISNYCSGQVEEMPREVDWEYVKRLIEAPGRAGANLLPELPPISRDAATQVGGLGVAWQSNVLEGLTAFMLERAKMELVSSFLVKMKGSMCGEDSKRYFRSTCILLGRQEKDAPPPIGAAFQAALTEDMTLLVGRFAGDECGPALLVGTAAAVVAGLQDGHQALEVLASIRSQSYETCDAASRPMIIALHRISSAVTLLMRKDGVINKLTPVLERELLQRVNDGATEGEPVLDAASVARLHGILERIVSIREELAKETSAARFNVYTAATLEVLQVAINIAPQDSRPAKAVALLRRVDSCLGAARTRDYGKVLVDAFWIADELKIKLPASVTQYGSLAADLATARSAEEVTGVLESAATPVGGYKNKRRAGGSSVTLNGYLGAQFGGEWLGGTQAPAGPAMSAGLAAPIGVEYSRGFGWGSLGVMVGVLDLGTLVSYRLTEEDGGPTDVQKTPSFSFEQVLAPGLYGVLGISSDVPFSVGLGMSLTPALREVVEEQAEPGGGTSQDRFSAPAFRVGLFAGVDLPLLSF